MEMFSKHLLESLSISSARVDRSGSPEGRVTLILDSCQQKQSDLWLLQPHPPGHPTAGGRDTGRLRGGWAAGLGCVTFSCPAPSLPELVLRCPLLTCDTLLLTEEVLCWKHLGVRLLTNYIIRYLTALFKKKKIRKKEITNCVMH